MVTIRERPLDETTSYVATASGGDRRPRGITVYLGATLHERNVSCLLLQADLSAPCGRILGHLLAACVGAEGTRQSQAGTIYVRIGAAALHVLYTITYCGIIGKHEPSPQGALASSMIQSRLFLFCSTHVMTNTIDNEGGGPRCTTVQVHGRVVHTMSAGIVQTRHQGLSCGFGRGASMY